MLKLDPEDQRNLGEADPGARLNILAANGSRLLATTWGETEGQNTPVPQSPVAAR